MAQTFHTFLVTVGVQVDDPDSTYMNPEAYAEAALNVVGLVYAERLDGFADKKAEAWIDTVEVL